ERCRRRSVPPRPEEVQLPCLAEPRGRNGYLPAICPRRVNRVVAAMPPLAPPHRQRGGCEKAEKVHDPRPWQRRHPVEAEPDVRVRRPPVRVEAHVVLPRKRGHDFRIGALRPSRAVQLRCHHRYAQPRGRRLRELLQYFCCCRCHGTLLHADGYELIRLPKLLPFEHPGLRHSRHADGHVESTLEAFAPPTGQEPEAQVEYIQRAQRRIQPVASPPLAI